MGDIMQNHSSWIFFEQHGEKPVFCESWKQYFYWGCSLCLRTVHQCCGAVTQGKARQEDTAWGDAIAVTDWMVSAPLLFSHHFPSYYLSHLPSPHTLNCPSFCSASATFLSLLSPSDTFFLSFSLLTIYYRAPFKCIWGTLSGFLDS